MKPRSMLRETIADEVAAKALRDARERLEQQKIAADAVAQVRRKREQRFTREWWKDSLSALAFLVIFLACLGLGIGAALGAGRLAFGIFR